KTRTAAALNLAIWPQGEGKQPRSSLAAAFAIGASRWLVDLDAGSVRYECDGNVLADPPALLPPADNRDRYNLPLHELLGAEDRGGFAELILQESAGGFDLSGAAETLKFREAATASSKETATLRAAEEVLRQQEVAQRAVQD